MGPENHADRPRDPFRDDHARGPSSPRAAPWSSPPRCAGPGWWTGCAPSPGTLEEIFRSPSDDIVDASPRGETEQQLVLQTRRGTPHPARAHQLLRSAVRVRGDDDQHRHQRLLPTRVTWMPTSPRHLRHADDVLRLRAAGAGDSPRSPSPWTWRWSSCSACASRYEAAGRAPGSAKPPAAAPEAGEGVGPLLRAAAGPRARSRRRRCRAPPCSSAGLPERGISRTPSISRARGRPPPPPPPRRCRRTRCGPRR